MTLRAKLLLAQSPLGLALVVLGVVTVTAIASLGQSPHIILQDNFRSVLAAERMLDEERELGGLSLERATGGSPQGAAQAQASARFEAELRAQEANITEPEEGNATRELRASWTRYERALSAIDADPPSVDHYLAVFVPASRELRAAAHKVLAINEDAMQRKSDAARRAAERTTSLVVGVAIAAVLAGVVLALWLTARLLRPLSKLSQTVRRLGEGDLDAKAPVTGRDEIAALGMDFNAMAERLRQYRSSSLGELLQAQQASQAAIDSLPDPVLVTDTVGVILNLNGAAEALLRRSASAELTVHALEPELRNTVERVRDHVLAGRGPYAPRGFEEAVHIEEDGGPKHLLARASPLYSEEGAITGVTVVLQDVTRLMRFDELKNDLVATVAHEFRTPLTSLRMAIHLCADEMVGPLTEKQADLMAAARQDCERLQSIVDDLLDLSRIQSGRLELSWATAAPSDLVAAAVRQHRPDAAAAGIDLTGFAGEHLPPLAVDRERIEVVLSNLVANALKHTPRGGAVQITAVEGEGSVRFEIKDTGPGIAPEYHERIFEKFFRVPGTAAGGVGLGLYLAREIVVAHGGRIGVESAPGLGSRFWFTVPLARERAQAASTVPAAFTAT